MEANHHRSSNSSNLGTKVAIIPIAAAAAEAEDAEAKETTRKRTGVERTTRQRITATNSGNTFSS